MTILHSGIIECCVASLINYRLKPIVPNVSWGLGFKHECDMLVLEKNNTFTEIEIKISISDLKADFKKPHNHSSKYISRLIYAFPEEMLEKALPLIPLKCGIIIVKKHIHSHDLFHYQAHWYRVCKCNKNSEKIPDHIRIKFYELGLMRIWSLKKHNNKM